MRRRYIVHLFILILSFIFFLSCFKGFDGFESDGDYVLCFGCGNGQPPNLEVIIKDRKFNPDTLIVYQGATVIWINNDSFTHSVTSDDKVTFNFDNIATNYGYSYKTTVAGTFNYHCCIHPDEIGVLIVNPVVNHHIIVIKDHKFSPDKLAVNRDETVIWYNYDLHTHIVVSEDRVSFNSDSIFRKDTVGPSSYYLYKASVEGTFKYHCQIHPGETGVLIVNDRIAPTIPGNLLAQAGSNSVQLSWTASVDNIGVHAYNVLQDNSLIGIVPATTLAKFISGLTAQTTYTFGVFAFDVAGNQSETAEVTITTLTAINTGEPGLIASYPFDDNVNDDTPYANHGLIGGNPGFITRPGASGKAIKFDGDKDSVYIKNAIQLISEYTSLSFWIRVDGQNLADAEAYVIDFGHWNQRWKVSLPQHLRIVWTTNSNNVNNANAISDMDSGVGKELVKNIWWHVTMVHDGANDIIYLNGIEVRRKPAPGILNNTTRPLVFGNNPIEGGQYFNGALDNVKIYNKTLTASEVTKLFITGTTL